MKSGRSIVGENLRKVYNRLVMPAGGGCFFFLPRRREESIFSYVCIRHDDVWEHGREERMGYYSNIERLTILN